MANFPSYRTVPMPCSQFSHQCVCVDNVLVSHTFQNGWMRNRDWRRGGDHSHKSLMRAQECSCAARGQGVTISYCGPHFNVKVVKNNHNIKTTDKKVPLA